MAHGHNPVMAGLSLDAGSSIFAEVRQPPAELTRAERVVLERLLTGAHNRQIADELSLSETTIRTHLTHIYSKFGVDGRAALLVAVYGADVSGASSAPVPDSATSRKSNARRGLVLALVVVLALLIVLLAWAMASGYFSIPIAAPALGNHPPVEIIPTP
jgi:DNA-binding CsgD family transcriptional regulator